MMHGHRTRDRMTLQRASLKVRRALSQMGHEVDRLSTMERTAITMFQRWRASFMVVCKAVSVCYSMDISVIGLMLSVV